MRSERIGEQFLLGRAECDEAEIGAAGADARRHGEAFEFDVAESNARRFSAGDDKVGRAAPQLGDGGGLGARSRPDQIDG